MCVALQTVGCLPVHLKKEYRLHIIPQTTVSLLNSTNASSLGRRQVWLNAQNHTGADCLEIAPPLDGFPGFNLPVAMGSQVRLLVFVDKFPLQSRFMSSCLPEFGCGGNQQFHIIMT